MNIGPSAHCSPHPTVENAEAGFRGRAQIGDTVYYSCKKGYELVSGDGDLKCAYANDYSTRWIGSKISCAQGNDFWSALFSK